MRRGVILVLLVLAVVGVAYLIGGEGSHDDAPLSGPAAANRAAPGPHLEVRPPRSDTSELPPPPGGVVRVPAMPEDVMPEEGPLRTLHGQVVGPEGVGVAGVELTASLTRRLDRKSTRLPTVRATTGADGGFDFPDVDVISCIAHVEVKRLPEAYARPASLRVPCTDEPLVIRLAAGVSITGVVIADPNRGFPGQVTLHALWVQAGDRRARTGVVEPDGSFVVRGLTPGTRVDLLATPAYERRPNEIRTQGGKTLHFGHSWQPESASALTRFGVEAGARDVELRLGGTPCLDIVAIDDGKLLPNGLFTIGPVPETASGVRMVRSDAQGRLVARGLPPGRYRITPTLPSGVKRLHEVRLPFVQQQLDFSGPAKRVLRGRVVGAGDLAGFRILVDGEIAVLTGADGSFSLVLFAERVDLRAERYGDDRWGQVRDVDTTAGDVEIRLQPGVSITGRILDVDGKPSSTEASVVVFNEHVRTRVAVPRGGRFAIYGLRPGSYTLEVSGFGVRAVRVEAVEAGTRDLRIVIPTGR